MQASTADLSVRGEPTLLALAKCTVQASQLAHETSDSQHEAHSPGNPAAGSHHCLGANALTPSSLLARVRHKRPFPRHHRPCVRSPSLLAPRSSCFSSRIVKFDDNQETELQRPWGKNSRCISPLVLHLQQSSPIGQQKEGASEKALAKQTSLRRLMNRAHAKDRLDRRQRRRPVDPVRPTGPLNPVQISDPTPALIPWRKGDAAQRAAGRRVDRLTLRPLDRGGPGHRSESRAAQNYLSARGTARQGHPVRYLDHR